MEGYVMNVTSSWAHAMKRAVAPGQKIPLDELFQQYGIKHSLTEGPEFVEWLRTVKLKDNSRWKIIIDNTAEDMKIKAAEAIKASESSRQPENVAPMVASKMTVDDVVNLSVRQARDLLPKVTDLNLLKYSLQEANQLANKDSLCKVIRKRITDLQLCR